MTITANYTPAPGEDPDDLGPDEFTAGSILILNCTVQGKSGTLSYEWSVTGNPDTPGCRKCNIVGSQPHSSTLRLEEEALNSYHAGVYTCTVSEIDRDDSGNSDNFNVTVVGEIIAVVSVHSPHIGCYLGLIGAGIYSTRGEPRFRSRPIANNGLIVSESDGEQRIECVSSHSVPGVFTGLNGNILTSAGIWTVAKPFGRPGVRRLKTASMTAADQGIYTCTVLDSNDNQIVINVGLYPTEFNSERQYIHNGMLIMMLFLIPQSVPPSQT